MPVKLIEDKQLWDRFIDKSPRGLVFHRWDFLKLLEKYSTYQLLPYGIYKGEELICVFPLFYKKILGQKVLFCPPPQSGVPYIGPVLHWNYDSFKQDKKESYINLAAREIDSEIRKISPRYLQVCLTPGLIDIRPFINLNYGTIPSFTYIWDLNPPIEDIWNSCSRVCKQNIRKGLNRNYKLERSTDHSKLVESLTGRYVDKGKSFVVNPQFLGEVQQTFPESCSLYYLCDNDEKVSGILTYEQKGYVFGWLGLPKPKETKDTYANEVLLWKLIERAKLEGHTTLEVAGANTLEMCVFRNKLNPQLEICFKLYKKGLVGVVGEKAWEIFMKKR